MKPIDDFFTIKELNLIEQLSQRCLEYRETALDERMSDIIYSTLELMEQYNRYRAISISDEDMIKLIELYE